MQGLKSGNFRFIVTAEAQLLYTFVAFWSD